MCRKERENIQKIYQQLLYNIMYISQIAKNTEQRNESEAKNIKKYEEEEGKLL